MDDRKEWAEHFKKNHRCETCPFVVDAVDIGVGIQCRCDHVCQMSVEDILKEMEGYCV